MSEKYKNLKVKELQELLQKNDMPYTGKKEDLVERLVKLDERKAMENLEKEFELEDDFDESKLILTEDIQTDAIFSSLILDKPAFYEKESVLSDDEEDLTPVAVEKKSISVSPKVKAVTPPVTEPVIPSPTTTTTTTATTATAVEITLQESVTSTEVAPASSFKFTPITFESKTVKSEPLKKSTPVKKSTAATPKTTTKSANTKPFPTTKSNSKPVVSKAFGSRIPAPKPSKSTTVNTPPKSNIRPTRSTKTPLPKSTKSNKDTKSTPTPKAKAAPTNTTTTASLAVQEKKAPLTAEQIEKARLEAERKLERSKRFGIKLDEKDMKEIRAARFGIIATTTNMEGEKKKEKEGKQPTKETAAQDILKKRAERFGIPEKKIVPTNHKKLMTVTKNAVKQGRVQKMAPKTELIKKAVTKSNILNKKHNNIATRLNAPIMAQNKRTIMKGRKTDTPIQGRVITIAPIRSAPVRQVKTSARDIIINANNNIRRPTNNTKKPVSKDIGNGRTVTVGTSNNNKRRRGRGPESSHQPLEKKRRN
ncbi:uncharacterized protein EV154DRAFT_598859 [Mucor mucedo]|uniref:uncharacterized protein n=1 Tax=Mucor mucedo TaxID=29922 RepID=UPI00221E6F7F|nr:uncharacterized protein EV154DRAFT_598859 [Mucor mucedo]KAI7895906.1 hypothetical protein EV154DRAFT_598859 [Mucor mucedo]